MDTRIDLTEDHYFRGISTDELADMDELEYEDLDYGEGNWIVAFGSPDMHYKADIFYTASFTHNQLRRHGLLDDSEEYRRLMEEFRTDFDECLSQARYRLCDSLVFWDREGAPFFEFVDYNPDIVEELVFHHDIDRFFYFMNSDTVYQEPICRYTNIEIPATYVNVKLGNKNYYYNIDSKTMVTSNSTSTGDIFVSMADTKNYTCNTTVNVMFDSDNEEWYTYNLDGSIDQYRYVTKKRKPGNPYSDSITGVFANFVMRDNEEPITSGRDERGFFDFVEREISLIPASFVNQIFDRYDWEDVIDKSWDVLSDAASSYLDNTSTRLRISNIAGLSATDLWV